MKKLMIAGAVVALATASQANAVTNLVYAGVTGQSSATAATGSAWTAGADDGNWTLFLQQPSTGPYVNRDFDSSIGPSTGYTNDFKGLSDPTETGSNVFRIAGDSFRQGETVPSDPFYLLTLRFADGAQITGLLNNGVFQTMAGSTATVAGSTYTLTGFDWSRTGNVGSNDDVGMYRPGANGNGPDYVGRFTFTAVPEPATWGMMLIGFAMVGGAARYRRRNTSVVYS